MADTDVIDVAISAPAPAPASAKAAPKAKRKYASRRRTGSRASAKARKPTEAPTLGEAVGASVDAFTHPPTDQIDPDQSAKLHGALLMVFGMLTLYMEEYLRPTEAELESVLLPAERIVLRRVTLKVGTINPDIYDGLQILIGVGAYAARVTRSRRQFPPGAARDTGTNNPGRVAKSPASAKAASPDGWQRIDGIANTLANLHSSSQTPPARGVNGVGNETSEDTVGG